MLNTKCYCISLRENEAIRARLTQELQTIGIQVEYHIVDRSPLGGVHGCLMSHVEVMKKGLASSADFIMVLEDDVYFKLTYPTVLSDINKYLTTLGNDNWCFCFGYFTESPAARKTKLINQLYHCYCTHAYLVPRQTAEGLATMQWSGIPVDHQWKQHIDSFYVPYPMIAFQHDHKSTISNSDLIYRIGFKNMARLCEVWSCVPAELPIFAVVLVIVVVVMIYCYYQV